MKVISVCGGSGGSAAKGAERADGTTISFGYDCGKCSISKPDFVPYPAFMDKGYYITDGLSLLW